MDLVIVRENTEGFYADRNMHQGIGEFMPTPDMALAVRKVTAEASNRIARSAFDLARARRKKVTAVHKQNVLRVSDALFLREVRAVAADYPDVELDDVLVDAATALLIRTPERFDVMVTTNMFGDILSDEMAVICGSLGMMASASLGANRNRHGYGYGLFEPSGGTAPDIAGQDKANPCAQILSAALMLRHSFGLEAEAKAIELAVEKTIAEGIRTADIAGGGKAVGTKAMGAAILARL